MRVLVISDVKTHPVNLGSSKFIVEYCDLLRSLGHEVFFLYVIRYTIRTDIKNRIKNERAETMKAWNTHYLEFKESIFSFLRRKLFWYYRKVFNQGYIHCDDKYYSGLGKFVQQVVNSNSIDACLVNYFWLTKVFQTTAIRKKGIITHDTYSFYRQRNPEVAMEFDLLPNEEAKALQRCNYVFAMQDEEAVFFKYLAPQSIILKNYCSYKICIQPRVGNHDLLFFSSEWSPNILGLRWFVDEVFPQIRRRFPDCRLVIGGSICQALEWLNDYSDVELLGYVEDPADFYQKGDIVINPTYSGAGLKIKTFEAMSYGKVVIAHPHSMDGIFHKHNAPILVADHPEDWVCHLEQCWNDISTIERIKDADKVYLQEMNQFITTQYNEFLT